MNPQSGMQLAVQTVESDPIDEATLSDEQLEDRLCCQSAHITVAESDLVLLIAEFDRRELWGAQGLRSCAHWLNWRCGTTMGAAREQVRVGRALPTLPLVRAAFALGRISFSKVRAVTRVATPELEESLLDLATSATASQLEHLVRAYRRADADEGINALARHATRFLRSHTEDDGMVVIHARLSPEDGAFVLAAIEAVRQGLRSTSAASGEPHDPNADLSAGRPHDQNEDKLSDDPDKAEGSDDADADAADASKNVSAETHPGSVARFDEPEQESADALVAICESSLRQHTSEERADAGALVLVHVDEAVLADPAQEGCSSLDGVGRLAAHTARRLACDAGVCRLVFRQDGQVDAGAKTRTIPRRMRRAVVARDRGCRFPGCTQQRFVDVHHVVFWADGGRTEPTNLVCLCRFHHRLVHEGGYRLDVTELGRLEVHRPDGRHVPAVALAPEPVDPDIVARHAREGRAIDAQTLGYGGGWMNYALAIDSMLQVAGGEERRRTSMADGANTTPLGRWTEPPWHPFADR
jgi:hypothetical protein